ncbi:TetR/AcrR family transcriptional regulator [Clostridium sp. MB05]|jgi:TetR/AcrR family transcriptional regulator, transcriptional repressor for nem operon|uniref:TetR/AcrR family transcriptional regulator n=1 Tax=Clostridium sp. MB05 TaxID=3376682 RepID=UPI003982A2AF
MARNKYPEQTVEQILSASAKLFIENGYEKTTIQDIMDELKLSKGAIYHHFKSKEEILNAVLNKRSIYVKEMLDDLIKNTKAENAREKLKKILISSVTDREAHAIDLILSSQIKSPQFVVSGLQSNVNEDASIISKLLLEGIKDGSIKTEYPDECAEIFMLLLNIWTNPVLFSRNLFETEKRLKFLQQMMRQLGIDIVSDELIENTMKGYSNMKGFKEE